MAMDPRDFLSMAGFRLPPASVFDEVFRVYSMAMCTSMRAEAEMGDKIVLPSSALATLTNMRVQYPMMFRLSNESKKRSTHVGVLEFSAEEGRVYVPHWIMSNLLLSEGALVAVRNVTLPSASFVKFQPHTTDFTQLHNPKAVLEKQLKTYSALTVGDTLMVAHIGRKYYLDVLECKPANAVSIIETDVLVDFAPPLDYREPAPRPAAGLAAAGTASPALGSSVAPIALDGVRGSPALGASKSSGGAAVGRGVPESKDGYTAAGAASSAADVKPAKFVPFAGPAYKLEAPRDSKAGSSPMLGGSAAPGSPALGGKSISAGGVVISGGPDSGAPAKPRTLNKFEAARREKAFQGTAHTLR